MNGKAEVPLSNPLPYSHLLVGCLISMGIAVMTWLWSDLLVKGLKFKNCCDQLQQKYHGFTHPDVRAKLKLLCYNAWPQGRELQLKLALSLCLMAVGRVANIVIPMCGKLIVDDISEKKDLFWDVLSMTLGQFCLQGGIYVQNVLRMARTNLSQAAKRDGKIRLNAEITARIIRLPYQHYARLSAPGNGSHSKMHKLRSETPYAVETFPQYILFELVPVIVDLGTALYLFSGSFDPLLALVLFVAAMTEAGVSRCICGNNCPRGGTRMQPVMGIENVDCFENIKFFCNEEEEVKRHIQNHDCPSHSFEYRGVNALPSILTGVTNDCIRLLGSFFIAYQKSANHSTMSTGDYVLFSHYLAQFKRPIFTIRGISRRFKTFFADVSPLFELFQLPTEALEESNKDNIEIKGGLKVDHVTFSYTEGHVVLDDICFEVPEGQTVALVGPSGSGKSTLIRVLYKLLEPTKGAIFLDNINIKDLNLQDYRKSIGVVPQDCCMIGGTVRQNIAYGRLSATNEEIRKAACVANINHLLQREEEYEKMCKEREEMKKNGVSLNNKRELASKKVDTWRLSGGERQRIGIARALLKDPKYIFMDEATSALDSITEQKIQMALKEATKDKTCVIVAHRLSTISQADNIIVMERGRVKEQGTHQELLSLDGLYANLWKVQQGGGLNDPSLLSFSK